MFAISDCTWPGVKGLAAAAPVVPRVFAIYGINCATEVGAAYRHRSYCHKLGQVNTSLVLDTEASLKRAGGYSIQKGIIRETKATKQVRSILTVPSIS